MRDLAMPRGGCLRAWMPLSCLAAIALVPGSGASTDEVVLTPVKDNTLFESIDGSTSNGAGNAVFSGKTGFLGGEVKLRAVLAFDVAGDIPAGSTITSANLTLVLVQASPLGGRVYPYLASHTRRLGRRDLRRRRRKGSIVNTRRRHLASHILPRPVLDKPRR